MDKVSRKEGTEGQRRRLTSRWTRTGRGWARERALRSSLRHLCKSHLLDSTNALDVDLWWEHHCILLSPQHLLPEEGTGFVCIGCHLLRGADGSHLAFSYCIWRQDNAKLCMPFVSPTLMTFRNPESADWLGLSWWHSQRRCWQEQQPGVSGCWLAWKVHN